MTRLLELSLRNFALVRNARLDCDPGFGIVTGETGAGKSLCIAALRFVLGGRADGDMAGEATAVRAVFEPAPENIAVLAGLGPAEDDLITLTREVTGSGRAACRINGSLVSQATLREVGDQLAEVTAQGASQRLVRKAWQRRTLDSFGGHELAQARSAMAAAYSAWRRAEAILGSAREATRRSAAELDAAAQVIADLEPMALEEGEEESLGEERRRLRHAAAIATAAAALARAATGCDEETGAAPLLEQAIHQVVELGGIDRALGDLGDEAAALASALRDLSLSALRHADRVEFDAHRLEALEQRLDVLARVRRRYGSLGAALEALDAAHLLRDAVAAGVNLDLLDSEASRSREDAAAAAQRLTAARQAAGRRLERTVEQRLRVLELAHARFRVVLGVTPAADGVDSGRGSARCTADGVDSIEFRLAANPGGMPLPLDEGPSGGELSRLALALAAVTSTEGQPLLVLDEVDSGIGGETAARVGDLLAEIGTTRQVIAVTHRPEIAARAGWHLLVVKREETATAESVIRPLGGPDRVAEVARLMSGRITPAALARAAELLHEGARAGRRHRRVAS